MLTLLPCCSNLHIGGSDLELVIGAPSSGEYTALWNTTGIEPTKRSAREDLLFVLTVMLDVHIACSCRDIQTALQNLPSIEQQTRVLFARLLIEFDCRCLMLTTSQQSRQWRRWSEHKADYHQ